MPSWRDHPIHGGTGKAIHTVRLLHRGQGRGAGGVGSETLLCNPGSLTLGHGSETLLCNPGSLTLGHVSGHPSDLLFTYLKMGAIIVPTAVGLLRELNKMLQ